MHKEGLFDGWRAIDGKSDRETNTKKSREQTSKETHSNIDN